MEIEGYPNYLIYPDGRVWSKPGKGRFLKHAVERGGYHSVSLYQDRKRKIWKVHRLVAIHYIPNPDNKPEVDHINQNPHDNRLENLRWATRSEQEQNKGDRINNTSGHKYISYHKQSDSWRFEKTINKKRYLKYFETKIGAMCCKFCFLLLTQRRKRLACTVENMDNVGNYNTNKSGHTNISYARHKKRWTFAKVINGKRYLKYFKTKIEALCYKFCFILLNQRRKRLACGVRR